ncbi:guanidinobutyrase-like [Patiria miniata]|uniref:Agmatinase n=1 Tax=Patiria miniata TaxID=46514 RepID=A0A913ZGJ8_PATMI|nr:guanidinobutyrase-like [Patiria miniata]XP_038050549.1 guanidinobutyrase-like [Patiria miniata]
MLSVARRSQSKWASILRVTASSCMLAPEGVPRRQLAETGQCLVYNQPLSGTDVPRSGGIATMFRLPYQKTAEGLDACFVGIPLDIGTSNRSGTRLGPRQIRTESCLIRSCNSLGAAPYESLQVADIGDVSINLYDLKKAVCMIKEAYSKILLTGCKPLTLGGDHTLSYPVLQAIKGKHGRVGLVHVDAHGDTSDEMLGEKIAHGTPFRRAIEEDLVDPKKMIQIGLRGPQYTPDDHEWQKNQGVRTVRVEECHHKSLNPLMSEVRQMMGDIPVYISFDIDGIDPGFAPGTGTPEVGGLTPIQGMEIIRGCRGLNVIGGDLVEVSPPYDPFGTTALLGANLLFEMLCVLPGVKYPTK